MRKSILLAPVVAAVSAIAQPAPPQPPPAPVAPPMLAEFISAQPAFPARSVKNMPYSAEGVNESTQTLADGNRISRKTSSYIYRDSQGRTRNEHSFAGVGAVSGSESRVVSIYDPVAKVSITLNPDKTAFKHQMPSFDGAETNVIESSNGRTIVMARKIESSARMVRDTGSTGAVSVTRSPLATVTHDIVVDRVAGSPNVTFARSGVVGVAASGATWTTSDLGKDHKFRSESLGKKVIEGVEADGTRNVITIEAGQIGNERPIEIVDETWFSKEIEALVYSKHSDPRMGETTYRLTNIQRGEQPITLFEVPGDYKVHEGPNRVNFKIRSDKPSQE